MSEVEAGAEVVGGDLVHPRVGGDLVHPRVGGDLVIHPTPIIHHPTPIIQHPTPNPLLKFACPPNPPKVEKVGCFGIWCFGIWCFEFWYFEFWYFELWHLSFPSLTYHDYKTILYTHYASQLSTAPH